MLDYRSYFNEMLYISTRKKHQRMIYIMSIFNKFLLIFCFGIFVIGLNACPQQQPAEEGTVVKEEVVEEVEVPVATPAP